MSIVNKVLKKYNTIPIWITNMMAPFYYMIPENIRYGKIYQKEKAELDRISALTPDELETEKNQSLQRLIRYSYDHVPYYHRLFDENGINPDDIKTEMDLCRIPFLTKELLVKNRDALISNEFKKEDLIYLTTSGSTGTPTGFYVQKESPMREWVYCMHMLAPFGKRPGDSKLVMRGKSFWAQSKGKIWQWDAFKRELSINIFEMTPKNMEVYCKAIERHKPDFAYGYPSAMYTLCKYISTRPGGLKHQFKGFEAISEATLPEQRAFIEKTINAKVFSFYGMSERVIIATNTPDFDGYEIQQMYGIAELVDEQGNVITECGKSGELVGTSLLNYGMPLIRYKTGDMSSWASDDSLYGIEGRCNHDVLIGSDGKPAMTALNIHTDALDCIMRFQLRQDVPGIVKILIVPTEEYTETSGRRIISDFSANCSSLVKFEIELVKEIKPNKNGKTPIVVQNLLVKRGGVRHIDQVVGRCNHDVFIGSDGKHAMGVLNTHTDLLDCIMRFQFRQDTVGIVKIMIVPTKQYNKEHEKKILSYFSANCNGLVQFEIEVVNEIKPNKNGKIPMIVQNLQVNSEGYLVQINGMQ